MTKDDYLLTLTYGRPDMPNIVFEASGSESMERLLLDVLDQLQTAFPAVHERLMTVVRRDGCYAHLMRAKGGLDTGAEPFVDVMLLPSVRLRLMYRQDMP